MDLWERFRPPFVLEGETDVARLLQATSCPVLFAGVWQWLFSCLFLS